MTPSARSTVVWWPSLWRGKPTVLTKSELVALSGEQGSRPGHDQSVGGRRWPGDGGDQMSDSVDLSIRQFTEAWRLMCAHAAVTTQR
jgi:hypothetical protein